MALDGHVPGGPLAEKWDRHRFDLKLVNPANKRRHSVIVVGTGFMAFTALLMIMIPKPLIAIYVDPWDPKNAVLVGFALQYIVIAAAFQLFDGMQAVAAGALRGLQDTRIPMWIAAFAYWVPGIGTALALGFYTPLEGVGVWIGLATGLTVAAALLGWRWHRREALGLTRREARA